MSLKDRVWRRSIAVVAGILDVASLRLNTPTLPSVGWGTRADWPPKQRRDWPSRQGRLRRDLRVRSDVAQDRVWRRSIAVVAGILDVASLRLNTPHLPSVGWGPGRTGRPCKGGDLPSRQRRDWPSRQRGLAVQARAPSCAFAGSLRCRSGQGLVRAALGWWRGFWMSLRSD